MAKLVRTNASVKTEENSLYSEMKPRLQKWYSHTSWQTMILAGDAPHLLLMRTIPFEVAIKLVGGYIKNSTKPRAFMFDGSIYECLRLTIITATTCAINDYLENVRGIRRNDDSVLPARLEFLIDEFFINNHHISDDVMTEWIDHVIYKDLFDESLNIKTALDIENINSWMDVLVKDTFILNYQNFYFGEWKPIFDKCMENPTDLDFLSEYSMPEYVHENKEMESFFYLFGDPFLQSLVYYNHNLMLRARVNEKSFMYLPTLVDAPKDERFKNGVYHGSFYCENSIVKYAIRYNKFIDSKKDIDRSKDGISVIISTKTGDRSCEIAVNLVDLMTVISGKTDIKSYKDSCERFFEAFQLYTSNFIAFITEVFATHEINSTSAD